MAEDITVKERVEGKDYLMIPVTKGKAGIEICVDDLPADVYKEVLIQGLKHFINTSMGDIKTTGLDEKEAATAAKVAMDKAEENAEKLYTGKIRMSKGTRTKVSGEVKTEAMRLARLIIKQAIRDEGGKVSHYAAANISEAAKEWLETTEEGKECMAQAKANVESRHALDKASKIDVSGIKADPALAKKAEEKAAKAKGAKKASKAPVPGKAKPAAHAHA